MFVFLRGSVMKTIVVYYSYSGKTRDVCEQKAKDFGADLYEIKDFKKRPGMIKTFMSGCPKAMKRKPAKIEPFFANLDAYDKIVIGMPIWAGNPAPHFNNVVSALPKGKEVELVFTSGGGDSSKSKEGTIALVENEECKVVSYEDIKTAK